jgi:hypothetical protein
VIDTSNKEIQSYYDFIVVGAHHSRNEFFQRQHVASTPSCISGAGANRAFIDELLGRQKLCNPSLRASFGNG